jgi:hypothetical protein
LSLAREQPTPSQRVAALIDLSRREGIISQQRTSTLSEALTTAATMPVSNELLMMLATISQDAARQNDPACAAFAAQLLSEAYSKACACERPICDGASEKFNCLGMVETFAKYLDEFNVNPESMKLDNISIEARLLILKLYPVLGQRAPSVSFSDVLQASGFVRY